MRGGQAPECSVARVLSFRVAYEYKRSQRRRPLSPDKPDKQNPGADCRESHEPYGRRPALRKLHEHGGQLVRKDDVGQTLKNERQPQSSE